MRHPISVSSHGKTYNVVGKQLDSGMILVWDGSVMQWVPVKLDHLHMKRNNDTSGNYHL